MSASTRITFEAGPTHSGIEEALNLVRVAEKADADAIKFQYLDADRLVADREKRIDFKVWENGSLVHRVDSLHRILKRRELAREDWVNLHQAAKDAGLDFYCTASYADEFEWLMYGLEVDGVKVASADIDNLPLLHWLHHNTPERVEIQIDTGSANIWEVDRAVDILGDPLVHHVPSGYPAHLPSIHLRVISTLKMMYPELEIGFSDHSPGWEMDIAAVTLGADLVEKTITFDRRRQEIEHCFSLEPEEAKEFVQKIRELEVALGSTRRTIPSLVLDSRKGFRRSVYLTKPLKEGEEIRAEHLELRRPGYNGVPPEALHIVKGRTAKRPLAVGPLRWSDV